MSRIFCIVGKSSSGKDTFYRKIISKCYNNLTPIIPYTTRPKRNGEIDCVDYNFVSESQLSSFERDNQIIEKRHYYTTQGIWYYFTLKFDLQDKFDYILITTIEGAIGISEYYGAEKVHLVYLNVDDRTRLLRCIDRESKQINPNYEEVCRRFIADQKDFSEDKFSMFDNIHSIDTGLPIDFCIKRWEEIFC